MAGDYSALKMKFIIFVSIIILLSCSNDDLTGPNQPSADDFYWSKSQSPIHILSHFLVPQTETLVIEPGVEIYFAGSNTNYDFNYDDSKIGMLHVKGKIISEGSEDEPILFSVYGDRGSYWGGIFIDSTSIGENIFEFCKIEFSRNLFIENMEGAISFNNSFGIIKNCDFNKCVSNAISSSNATLEISNNIFWTNTSWGAGRSIYCFNNSNCLITENEFNGIISGIYIKDSSDVIITKNIFQNYLYSGIKYDDSVLISNNVIKNCDIGIECRSVNESMIINNLIQENSVGIYCYLHSELNIINNTIIKNSSGIESLLSQLNCVNNIIALNDLPFAASTESEIYLSYSFLQEENMPNFIIDIGNNILNTDPFFIDPENDNYQLQLVSPCINTGNSDLENLPETDLAGNPRISGNSIDMGVYEFQE